MKFDPTKNQGVIVTAICDRGIEGIVDLPNRTIKDWTPFLPTFETQRDNVIDMMDCVTFSLVHCVETQVNYLISVGAFSQEALNYFNSAGYMQNGKWRASPRYNAKMNGTTMSGQQQGIAGDDAQKNGFLPDSDWSFTPNMTWDEYYSPVPQNLIDKARGVLKYLYIQKRWLGKADLPTALLIAPVQIATEVCAGWDSGQAVQKCSGQPVQHATTLYGIDSLLNYKDLDHYSPYLQLLSKDYELPYNMQFIVTPAIQQNGGLSPSLFKKLLDFILTHLMGKIVTSGRGKVVSTSGKGKVVSIGGAL